MTSFNQEQIKTIVKIALDAGEIAKRFFFKRDYQIKIKEDYSKVSTADFEISKFIITNLKDLLPDIEIICEENHPKKPINQQFILIDPIDGTNSFINQNSQFAINIALINNQKSVFGLIYAPLFENGKMAFNANNKKVFLITDLADKTKSINDLDQYRIFKNKKIKDNILKVVASKRSNNDQIKNYLLQHYQAPNYEIEKISSSVKFFRLIENKSDIFINTKKTMEWDIAAGHSIIESLGGNLKKMEIIDNNFILKEKMPYNKEGYINGAFIANP